MNETIKAVFGDDRLSYSEFCERLDGFSPEELFVDRADYDILSDSYNELKSKLDGYDPEWENKAKKIVFDGALDFALTMTDAHDPRLVRGLLNEDELEYAGGNIIGLDEQLERIRAEHGYLFENCAPVPSFGRSTGGARIKDEPDERKSQTNSVLRAVFGRK